MRDSPNYNSRNGLSSHHLTPRLSKRAAKGRFPSAARWDGVIGTTSRLAAGWSRRAAAKVSAAGQITPTRWIDADAWLFPTETTFARLGLLDSRPLGKFLLLGPFGHSMAAQTAAREFPASRQSDGQALTSDDDGMPHRFAPRVPDGESGFALVAPVKRFLS